MHPSSPSAKQPDLSATQYAREAVGGIRRALSALRGSRRAGSSTLLISTPSVAAAFSSWPGPQRLGVPGLPPHVTVLYPFLAPESIDASVEDALDALAARTPRFSYTLSHLARFPGVLFIAPEPPEQFVELTQSVCAAWPAHPPYGGAYEQIVPHVTVALGAEPAGLADAIETALPIQATANELSLLCQEHATGPWLTRRAFRLGS